MAQCITDLFIIFERPARLRYVQIFQDPNYVAITLRRNLDEKKKKVLTSNLIVYLKLNLKVNLKLKIRQRISKTYNEE